MTSEGDSLPLIPGAPLQPLDGTEQVTIDGYPLPGGQVLKFWQWVASDLRDNTLSGEFAEWLVGVLLGIDMGVRIGWDSVDHRKNGVTIEVKASAYIQGWGQRALSCIYFGPLVKHPWDSVSGVFAEEPQLSADWYVFALETCKDGPAYNPLDLGQWEFYVIPRAALEALARGQGLSLKRVNTLATPMTAHELQRNGRVLMGLDPLR